MILIFTSFICFRTVYDAKINVKQIMIGASLSEPHTREFGAEISVCFLACMLACIRRTSRANCRSKCSRVHGRTTAASKSTSHRFDTVK